jgi:MFS family permease
MLLARFFLGVGGCKPILWNTLRTFADVRAATFSTMVGGVVSDIYHARDRNTPMALFSGAALLGTGLGPLVSGFIAQHTSWRWIFYVQTYEVLYK